jgi:molybdopterin adenylyltransferase
MIKVAILTISDSCAQGRREDLSGLTIRQLLAPDQFEVLEHRVVPDDRQHIVTELMRFSNQLDADLVLTTGGTGLGPRDVTPEATASVCERMVPGLGELMRTEGHKQAPNAVLSSAVCGIRNGTLIVNLPGSVKAVRECLGLILGVLPHAVEMMHGGGHEKKNM